LNDREAARDFKAREGVLSGKELLLSFKDFVVARFAFFVTEGREFHGLAAGFDGFGLFDSAFFVSAARDKRVGHFAEGNQSSVLILKLRFFARGFGLTVAAGQSSAGEQWAGSTGRERPRIRAGRGEVVQFSARTAVERCQADAREKVADRNADAIVANAGSSLSKPLPNGTTEFDITFTLLRPGLLHVTIYDLDNHDKNDNAYAGIYLGDVVFRR